MSTATIRVSTDTRDLLAEQARERGLSLAALLAEIAEGRRRESLWQSERRASELDAGNPAVREEWAQWDSTAGDGIA